MNIEVKKNKLTMVNFLTPEVHNITNSFSSICFNIKIIKASKKGYKIYIAYIIQREDCKKFVLASDIDPEYSKLLSKAVKKKLNILCYDCKFSLKGIKLNNKIKYFI